MDVASKEGVDLCILVNNVGTNIRKPTTEYTAEDVSHLVNTNFISTLSLSQALQPSLMASSERRGRSSAIVNISSVSGGPTCTQTGANPIPVLTCKMIFASFHRGYNTMACIHENSLVARATHAAFTRGLKCFDIISIAFSVDLSEAILCW